MAEQKPGEIHCAAFLAANADRDVHKEAHRFDRPPIATPGGARAPEEAVVARRLTATLATRRSSFDVWAALAPIELLLSDHRRLSPRFSFEQLTGQPSVAAGNEYRLTVTDAASLGRIESVCGALTGIDSIGMLGGARRMDVRVVRAGPWGGETGELVVEALRNHAMAGMASLWILVHGADEDDRMRLRLDVFEVSRWAWAPDRLAALDAPGGAARAGILDWSHLFERLAQFIDAAPVPDVTDDSFLFAGPLQAVARDGRVGDALALHPALAPLVRRAR